MMKILSLSMIGALAFASPALATNLTVTDIELPYQDTLTITGPINPAVTGYIGRQVLTTNLGTIDAWCIDLYHDDAVGGQSTAFTTSTVLTDGANPTPHTLSAGTVSQIAGLIAYGDSILNAHIGAQTYLNDFSASIQLAIWTDEYTGFTYHGNSTLTALVSADMAAAAAYGGNTTGLISINGGQGLVTADPVPEPMSIAVLGVGLLGLAGINRRKRV